jgi:GNAT superfamily N-acetyltransferase
MRVVELSKKNSADIEKLLKKVWPRAENYPKEWREKRTLSKDKIEEEMDGGYHYFGVWVDGRLAGIYKFSQTEEGLFGEHQSVDPDYVGVGVASKMYEQFTEEAARRGTSAYVNILLGDEAGLRLVTRYGFHKKGDKYQQSEGMWVQMWERSREAYEGKKWGD